MSFRRAFNFPWRTRRRIADDVERELAFHIESRARDLVDSGVAPHDAEAMARREFGDIDDARRYLERMDADIEPWAARRDYFWFIVLPLLALLGSNWGYRLYGYEEAVLPFGVLLSSLCVIMVVFTGWHGGKLVFEYHLGTSKGS